MNYCRLLHCAHEALTRADCERITALGIDASKNELDVPPKEGETSDSGRRTTLAWLRDEWIYEAINPALFDANREAGWNFRLAVTEPLQFTRYFEGDRYGWHTDQAREPHDGVVLGREFRGLVRKISFSLQLSDAADYEGGNFEIAPGVPVGPSRVHEVDYARRIGSIIFFPSFYYHRVAPVTSGIRTSLVGWVCGPAFV